MCYTFDSLEIAEALEQAGVPTRQASTYVQVLIDLRQALNAHQRRMIEARQRLEQAGIPAQQARAYAAVLAEATGTLEVENKAIQSQQRLIEAGVPPHQATV